MLDYWMEMRWNGKLDFRSRRGGKVGMGMGRGLGLETLTEC